MRAIIVGAGEKPTRALLQKLMCGHCVIIAADGGADVLAEHGITPNILMGDFDSISPETLERFTDAGCEIQNFPAEKDETDLELCADRAVAMGSTDILFTGVMGGRFDHEYASLLVLNRVHSRCESAEIVTQRERICIVKGRREFFLPAGSVFSVLPFLGRCTYTLEGNVKYPAHKLLLEGTRSVGNSNVSQDGRFILDVQGSALVSINE